MESLGAPPKEGAQESGEEWPEIEITSPEEDDATGRQSRRVTITQFIQPYTTYYCINIVKLEDVRMPP